MVKPKVSQMFSETLNNISQNQLRTLTKVKY